MMIAFSNKPKGLPFLFLFVFVCISIFPGICMADSYDRYYWEPIQPVDTAGRSYQLVAGAGTPSLTYRFFSGVNKTGPSFNQQVTYPDTYNAPADLLFRLTGGASEQAFNIFVSAYFVGRTYLRKGFASSASVGEFASIKTSWLVSNKETFFHGLADGSIVDTANMDNELKFFDMGMSALRPDAEFTPRSGGVLRITPYFSTFATASGIFDTTAAAEFGDIDTSHGLFITLTASAVPEPGVLVFALAGLLFLLYQHNRLQRIRGFMDRANDA